MKKIIVIVMLLLLAGCAKISETEQFIEDNPGVLDGDPSIQRTKDDTTVVIYEIEDEDTEKLLISVDSENLLILYMYCEDDSTFTNVYEERIYEADTYYQLIEKPACEVEQSLTVYFQVQEGNLAWVFVGEFPYQKFK